MEASGGETSAAKRAKPPWNSATGVDLLSALPEDILAKILCSVSSPDAVQTSVLSKRWRSVWKLLTDLHLPFLPEPAGSFREALEGYQVLLDGDGHGHQHQVRLRNLKIEGHHGHGQDGGGLASYLATWLPAAARRVSGSFTLLIKVAPMSNARRAEDETSTIELPCFDHATSISLGLCFHGRLAFPPADNAGAGAGVFSRLTELRLQDFQLQDPSVLSDAISPARCPCLQKFHIRRCRGLEKLAVRSTSLVNLDLRKLHDLWELTVEAPELKELHVVDCFSVPGAEEPPPPVLSFTVPGLVELDWTHTITEEAIGFAHRLPHLRKLGTFAFFVYGDDEADSCNRDSLRVLQGFRSIETLTLSLAVMMDMEDDYEYLMEAISVLPDLTTLNLVVVSDGHCFGDSSLHVLRICTGMRKLVLEFSSCFEFQEACLSGCICRQQSNWQTEELMLVSLQEIEIKGFGQSQHDIGFVEKLFGWATSLTKATIFFDESVSEGVVKELCWMFQFFRMPINLHIDFRYPDKKMVLCAAEE